MDEIEEVHSDSSDASSNESRAPGGDMVTAINERRRAALEDIDNAAFSWYFARTCLVAGIGFFTDAYDIFAINIGATMLGFIYGSQITGQLSANQDLGVKVAAPIGTFFGQLLFGWLADVVGRKRMYGIELLIIINGTFAQALCGSSGAVNIVGTIIVWRFLTGIGIGGDYPLSSVITSEFAATRIRGRMMTAVFSAQGWGNFTAALFSLFIILGYRHKIEGSPVTVPATVPDVDYCWRLLIGLGCIPGVIGLYFRFTIPETPRYTMDIERNVAQATQDIELFYSTGRYTQQDNAPVLRVDAPKATPRDFISYFSEWENGKVLLGAAWSWFVIDIVYYGLGLNSTAILTAIGYGDAFTPDPLQPGYAHAVWHYLFKISTGNLIVSAGGLLPGYLATFLLVDSWGRKSIQLMGFSVLTVIFACMGFGYDAMVNGPKSAQHAFFFLYCLANFFQNFGPNTTTFIVPGEVFPTRYRSTGHGISAAAGKLGAIVAQVIFSRISGLNGRYNVGGPNGRHTWLNHLFELYAFFMLTGVFSTLLIPETNGKTLEELSNENQETFVRGVRQTGGGEFVEPSPTPSAPSVV